MSAIRRDFQSEPEDNAIVAYGYIDHQVGISFEVLEIANVTDEEMILRKESPSISFKLRYDSINSAEIMPLNDSDISEKFDERIRQMLKVYNSNEVAVEARKFQKIDELRHPQFPDDILVAFFAEDFSFFQGESQLVPYAVL